MRFLISIWLLFTLDTALAQKDPEIVGQKDLSMLQGKSITIKLSDLYVEEKGSDDEDDTYPKGYELEIFKSNKYKVSGNTVTPDADFTGVLTVSLRVSNEKHRSNKFGLKITVKPVNQPPLIKGQKPLKTNHNTPLALKPDDLIVSDPDDDYPEGFSIHLSPGANYTLNGLTMRPREGFSGVLTVRVVVNDGTDNSAPFNLTVQVARNAAPRITGQTPLDILVNQTITVALSHLQVSDPDNDYPADFTLKVHPGNHYTATGATVQPEKDFIGNLSVKVSVNDGSTDSDVYNLKITVRKPANERPVITGQVSLSISEGQTLQIRLSHLVVQDPDNKYPDDFSLTVFNGENYSVQNDKVTPASRFTGNLSVNVSVNDGKASSEPFELQIEVIPKEKIVITGQKPLVVSEDAEIRLVLTDLIVNDPDDQYPQGFELQILQGNNYEVQDHSIIPHENFNGNLTVPVSVNNGSSSSQVYSLQIIVTPLNDPPEAVNVASDPLTATGNGPWAIHPAVEIQDVDDEVLVYAEIGFLPAYYKQETDRLVFENTENIRGVFDPATGILFFLGNASLAEYQTALRSVQYEYLLSGVIEPDNNKAVYLTLNDGIDTSQVHTRSITLERNAALDIPGGFTPNNDHANDTWKITPRASVEPVSTNIKVYDKQGLLVFESKAIDEAWDGHFNGNPLPADTYYYTIEMDLSFTRVNYKGVVLILR